MTDIPARHQDTKKTNPYTGYRRFVNPFFAMVLLFGLPYAISWYFIYSGDPVSFEKPNNHGELVSPVIALGKFSLEQEDGSFLTEADVAGSWSLITVTSACKKPCQETLFSIRQNRKSMGVNRKVIKPIILLETPEALNGLTVDLSKEFPQLAIITQQNEATQRIKKAFASVTPVIENSIFMVDPYGNLMMVYPAGSDQKKGVLKDLQRLLKVNKPDI
ncbi:MAG: hypothetical protein KUG73_04605 [Pseudomonadales bacterium]|nr:hypothetical protein [Pseudomonadales bacterium]